MKYDLETLFRIYGIKFEREFEFHPTRKWRADYHILDSDILIEVEGGSWSIGRHTRGKGYAEDCRKYNGAQLMGYIVLRYTYDMIKEQQEEIVHTIWKIQGK